MRLERGVPGATCKTQKGSCGKSVKIKRLPIRSRVMPLQAACKSPIRPQAFPIVCLNQRTSSSGPVPL